MARALRSLNANNRLVPEEIEPASLTEHHLLLRTPETWSILSHIWALGHDYTSLVFLDPEEESLATASFILRTRALARRDSGKARGSLVLSPSVCRDLHHLIATRTTPPHGAFTVVIPQGADIAENSRPIMTGFVPDLERSLNESFSEMRDIYMASMTPDRSAEMCLSERKQSGCYLCLKDEMRREDIGHRGTRVVGAELADSVIKYSDSGTVRLFVQ